jgi:hypothetical protein
MIPLGDGSGVACAILYTTWCLISLLAILTKPAFLHYTTNKDRTKKHPVRPETHKTIYNTACTSQQYHSMTHTHSPTQSPALPPIHPPPSQPHTPLSIPTNCLPNSTNVSSFPRNRSPSTRSTFALLTAYWFSGKASPPPGVPTGVRSCASGTFPRSRSAISWLPMWPGAQTMKRWPAASGRVAARMCAVARLRTSV